MTHDPIEDIQNCLKQEAIIIDVRTVEEFDEGHLEGSKNIPLHTLPAHLPELKESSIPVIACCRSGARSHQASAYLRSQGVVAVNAGPWDFLATFID